jgi:hypothetical protein
MLIGFLLLQATAADVFIFSPDSLRYQFEGRYHQGLIKSSLANFGNPPYGTLMLGRVFVPRDDQALACDPLKPIDWVGDPDIDNSPILLVDRGGCSFDIKVRNAQNIGARAVVIVDNIDEDPDRVIMSDSGAVGNLYIPSLLISKSDGELIKTAIGSEQFGRVVAMNIRFNLPKAVDVVNYEFWISSGNAKAIEFINEFADNGKKFKKDFSVFTPHYVMWHCPACSMDGYTTDDPNCFAGGKYCAPDPDNSGPLSGRDVLYEDLREICVFKQTEGDRHNYDLWFNYMKSLNSTCSAGINEKCSYSAMEDADVNVNKVKACVSSSFVGIPSLDDNILLREERKAWIEQQLPFHPAVTINNQTYRGDLEGDAIFSAICAGYEYDYRPTVCKPQEEETPTDNSSSMSTGTVVLIVLLCFGGVALILLAYSWWIRREYKDEMRRQLSDAVHQYISLSETSRLSSRA